MLSALPAGEYYAVAFDDLEADVARDAAFLEQLTRGATRVTLAEGATAEVTLRRFKGADVIVR